MAALRPMTEPEYNAWLARAIPSYAADKVRSGQWREDKAVEQSTKEFAQLLPAGLCTEQNHFYVVEGKDGQPAGMIWFAVKSKFGAPIAYLFNIEINPECRRQGLGAFALSALEGEVRKLGLTGIALHVFGHNSTAQALYAKLGYEPTNISLFKPVAAVGA